MNSVGGAINSLIAAKASAINTQVAFAVEAKRLDASKLEGQAAVQLIEAATQISKSLSTGKQFDAVG